MIKRHKAFIGAQWGDEGKGKLVDESAEEAEGRRVVVRFQGGPNAGHTQFVRSQNGSLIEIVTHASPSGLAANVDIGIGPDVAFDPEQFAEELQEGKEKFDYSGRVLISERVGILLPHHRIIDGAREDRRNKQIGTTLKGIGPFYECNAQRKARLTFADYVSDRFSDKLNEIVKELQPELSAAGVNVSEYLEETLALHKPIAHELKPFSERLEYRLQEYLTEGNINIEGGQGTELDVTFGTIPDVTSSHVIAPFAFASLGLPRDQFNVYLVEKLYPTRVGSGMMPTVAHDEFATVGEKSGEFGATTGRKRRVGYPDWVRLKRAALINDADGIYVTRADCVQGRKIKAAVGYHIGDGLTQEVPLRTEDIKSVRYTKERWQWNLWNGERDLADATAVDAALKERRAGYVNGGFESLPSGLKCYIRSKDAFVECPTVGVSIGPARGETVMRKF